MGALHEKSVEERGGYGKNVLFFSEEQFLGKSFIPCPRPGTNLPIMIQLVLLI